MNIWKIAALSIATLFSGFAAQILIFIYLAYGQSNMAVQGHRKWRSSPHDRFLMISGGLHSKGQYRHQIIKGKWAKAVPPCSTAMKAFQ